MVAILPFTFSVIPFCTKKGQHSVRRAQPTGQGILGKGPHPIAESKCTDWGCQNQSQVPGRPLWSTQNDSGVVRATSHLSQHRLSFLPRLIEGCPSGADQLSQELMRMPRGEHSCHSNGKRTLLVTSPPSSHAFSHWIHVC